MRCLIFWDPQMGPQQAPNISQNSVLSAPRAPRDARGRPEASREPVWSHFGAILENVGVMLGQFQTHFGSDFGPPPSLTLSWFLLFSRPLRPRFSGSAGARVSAYNSGKLPGNSRKFLKKKTVNPGKIRIDPRNAAQFRRISGFSGDYI